jgi:hypothetical protein
MIASTDGIRQLRDPSTKDLVTLLFMALFGLPLRQELARPDVDDATAIREEIRRREWELDR